MIKKQKTIDLYRKVKQEDGSYKYELAVSSFDYKPADGIWFVKTTPSCLSRECIIPLNQLPDYMPILNIIKHKSKIIDIISDLNCKSISDIANNLIIYLSKQTILPMSAKR